MSKHNVAEDVRDSEAEYLSLKILGQDNSILAFKVRKCRPLKKVMYFYCNYMGIDEATMRFVYDGRRIRKTDTPMRLGIAEDDTIEVYRCQLGGRGPYTCRN
ncbi:hypothetical protein Cfor_06914 [Coptotermes formosanus]|uniref:Ubiquitin-like domain-containing protein n=1 Tax=Coptotermes formosanus TaxID=36987 RepID=A0A6L2Q0U9_COPFO|nr:hypothetical protein Cfor_06914 [Coptotermes formosanus]